MKSNPWWRACSRPGGWNSRQRRPAYRDQRLVYTGTRRRDQREPGIAGSLWSPTSYGCDESACASPTMTFAPAGRPKVPPLVTITWMARTVSPLLVVAEQVTGVPMGEHAGAPAPSQTCSFRTTETLGITLIQVLAAGLSLTDIDPTLTHNRLVPFASDTDVPPPDVLLACDATALADTVHPVAVGRTQTLCACAKLVEVLLEFVTLPRLSLTEVPLLAAAEVNWSRSW